MCFSFRAQKQGNGVLWIAKNPLSYIYIYKRIIIFFFNAASLQARGQVQIPKTEGNEGKFL